MAKSTDHSIQDTEWLSLESNDSDSAVFNTLRAILWLRLYLTRPKSVVRDEELFYFSSHWSKPARPPDGDQLLFWKRGKAKRLSSSVRIEQWSDNDFADQVPGDLSVGHWWCPVCVRVTVPLCDWWLCSCVSQSFCFQPPFVLPWHGIVFELQTDMVLCVRQSNYRPNQADLLASF